MSINPNLYPTIPPARGSDPRPFWSVIVPAYKPQYLADALRSVLEQDPGPSAMEILVLDDCSPHGLEPLVRQIGGNRITYLRQPRNLGTYGTQNHGLTNCRGIWTHILNDDDWVLPGFYKAFQSALEKQSDSIGCGCCLYANANSSGEPTWTPALLRMTPGILQNWIQRIGVSNPLHPVATVIRRSVHERVGGYCPTLKYTADWEFYKRAAVQFDWWYEPRVMACYREHSGNCTAEATLTAEQIREFGRAIEMSEAYLPAAGRSQITAASRDYFASYALSRAEQLFSSGDSAAALRQLQAGLALSSSSPVLERLLVLMSKPSALPLRQLLPQFLQMIQSPAAV